jgi:capsule assembly protein Wzi
MLARYFPVLAVLLIMALPGDLFALSSTNIPVGSPVYSQIDKLAALGLISSDFAGIKPITKSEGARLLLEAESNVKSGGVSSFEEDLINDLRAYLKRELSLVDNPSKAPIVDVTPLSDVTVRYIYLSGAPRIYDRLVHDPGGEGVLGIGSGLRPVNPYPSLANQRGSEGTPLFENNEGIRYNEGSSLDARFTGEANLGQHVSLLVEPSFISTDGLLRGRLNKGYVKMGGGSLELEVGRDSNWLGFGERGALTLSNNADNFDLIKLSSPEPLNAGFLGKLKFAVIFSQFDKVMTSNGERQPWFYAIKASLKPVPSFEIGINLGRQQGGPGVDNSLRDNFQGLVGGTNTDNSNSLGGFELRWRMPFLRNTEAYWEYSGEDAAKFWPIVESYLAGIYIPRLTDDGKNDFRFEYFLGNNILYTHGQFTEGYTYEGMPIGHAQGGATEDFFFRYRHWFNARGYAGADYFYTTRGNTGRIENQALERKNALRAFWGIPLSEKLDMKLTYGWEQIDNLNLQGNLSRTNNLAVIETHYKF